MITPYTDLLHHIRLHAATAPVPLVLDAVVDVVHDFCTRSMAYRYAPVAMSVTAGVAQYAPAIPVGTEITKILSATYRGVRLAPTSEVLHASDGYPATPYGVYSAGAEVVIVGTPTVTEANVLRVTLALRPTLSSDGVDSEIVSAYRDVIVAGALARVLIVNAQPWTNANLAMYHSTRFEQGIENAKARADADHTAKVRTTNINWF